MNTILITYKMIFNKKILLNNAINKAPHSKRISLNDNNVSRDWFIGVTLNIVILLFHLTTSYCFVWCQGKLMLSTKISYYCLIFIFILLTQSGDFCLFSLCLFLCDVLSSILFACNLRLRWNVTKELQNIIVYLQA